MVSSCHWCTHQEWLRSSLCLNKMKITILSFKHINTAASSDKRHLRFIQLCDWTTQLPTCPDCTHNSHGDRGQSQRSEKETCLWHPQPFVITKTYRCFPLIVSFTQQFLEKRNNSCFINQKQDIKVDLQVVCGSDKVNISNLYRHWISLYILRVFQVSLLMKMMVTVVIVIRRMKTMIRMKAHFNLCSTLLC